MRFMHQYKSLVKIIKNLKARPRDAVRGCIEVPFACHGLASTPKRTVEKPCNLPLYLPFVIEKIPDDLSVR